MENKAANQCLAPGSWVGRSVPHEGSHAGVTGTIRYLDDLPRFRNELAVELATCSHAHARITFLDVTEAAIIAGIAAVLTAADVPGDNRFGALVHDEELLASRECRYFSQPIVALAGETRGALKVARSALKIELEPLPAILSIEQAIEAGEFLGDPRRIARGDATVARRPTSSRGRAAHRRSGALLP